MRGLVVIAAGCSVVFFWALAAGAALALWPITGLAASDPHAVGTVKLSPLGAEVDTLTARTANGRPVAVDLRGGRLVATTKIRPGTEFTIQVAARRTGVFHWVPGRRKTAQLEVTAPSAQVVSRVVRLGPNGRVELRFSAPVTVVSLHTPGQEARTLSFAKPHTRIVARLPGSDSQNSGDQSAGILSVAVAAAAWETLTRPVHVAWFAGTNVTETAKPQLLVEPDTHSALSPSGPIRLTFSQPVGTALGNDLPRLTPATPGAWRQTGPNTLEFVPSGLGFRLGSTVHVKLPRSFAGPAPGKLVWHVPTGSLLRLQQLLATLGYLPVTWRPRRDAPSTPASEARYAVAPPAGSFTWRYAHTPKALKQLWANGELNTLVRGAIMAFESARGLPADGYLSPELWQRLMRASVAEATPGKGYTFVIVHQTLPQSLQVWHNGKVVVRSLVNTGISAAPTANGVYPVFAHLAVTTMQGTEPSGRHYYDPGVPWVSYFHGGDAIHGFLRPGYGYPQSLGCVEAPYDAAEKIWPYTPVGTLVSVS